MVSRALGLVLAVVLGGCGSAAAPPSKAAGLPPSPESVNRQQPGGDAADPHAAALARLLSEPWGQRGDKDNQLLVALPDAENWKRVRYWGVEHFLGFRYGKEHHALVVVFVQEGDQERPTSEDCLRRFDAWGRPLIKPFDVDFDPFHPHHSKFKEKALVALDVEGKLSLGFSRPKFSAAWAAYPLYEKTCLISAVAVPWRTDEALARKVRDRFVSEGFAQLVPLTEVRPTRK